MTSSEFVYFYKNKSKKSRKENKNKKKNDKNQKVSYDSC